VPPRNLSRSPTHSQHSTLASGQVTDNKRIPTQNHRTNWQAHNGGENFMFADGHAKWMTLSATLAPSNFLWGRGARF